MSITTEIKKPLTMKNPPHPGIVVLQECIEPAGLTITAAAFALGVTRNTLSELLNEKRGISPEMAVRISKVFGGTEEGWLALQAQYDLARLRRDHLNLKRFVQSKGNSQGLAAPMQRLQHVNAGRHFSREEMNER